MNMDRELEAVTFWKLALKITTRRSFRVQISFSMIELWMVLMPSKVYSRTALEVWMSLGPVHQVMWSSRSTAVLKSSTMAQSSKLNTSALLYNMMQRLASLNLTFSKSRLSLASLRVQSLSSRRWEIRLLAILIQTSSLNSSRCRTTAIAGRAMIWFSNRKLRFSKPLNLHLVRSEL